jgi:sterol desaturase/sphingolipid hydroxylase (fatty acid hydroxylase superfamily)
MWDALANWLNLWVGQIEATVFQNVVLPVVYHLGFGGYAEDAFTGTEWLLVGVVQIAVMVLILGPLESCGRWSRDRPRGHPHRHPLHGDPPPGPVPAGHVLPAGTADGWLEGHLRLLGWQRVNVEDWWPGVTSMPLVSFFVYLLLFDLLDYWYHRLSHTYRWWWSLHAVHHSQRQMTLWSDNRNHLLDDILRDFVFAAVALAVGRGAVAVRAAGGAVATAAEPAARQSAPALRLAGRAPADFAALPSHAPRGGTGVMKRATADKPARLGGCNYGVIFPWWDMLFGTADFTDVYHPPASATRCRHPGRARSYGDGFLSQQWLGIKRLSAASGAFPRRKHGRRAVLGSEGFFHLFAA